MSNGSLKSLAVLLAFSGVSGLSAAEFRSARLWEADDHTRVVFDVSSAIDYKLFVLENPHRVVLDVPASTAAGLDVPGSKGAVRGIRSGKQGKSLRLVLDLDRGVQPKTFLLPPNEQHGHRLVIDLFERESKPVVVKTEAESRPSGQRKVVVAIDAGHGGEDPGALGAAGSREKDITLSVAKSLAEEINADPGMSAVLIRDRDFFIPLERRYALAREAKADLFVSIHADAFTNKAARGSSVFVLSQRGASSEAARMLARQENQADLVGGVSIDDKDSMLAAVLLDLSQGATMEASEIVASNVLRGLARIGNLHKRDLQRANFVVLRSPDVPSLLVETAFISNPTEEKRLNDPAHRAKLALAVTEGIREYFATTPPQGTWFAANPQRASHHIVARGESLSAIAARHGCSVTALRETNKLQSDNVWVGAVLKLPPMSG
jgi:N-acetylmuramoyl-L-alanine amidase